MYIRKITMENFKCFEGTVSLNFNKGLNFLIGNNNSGKTTIFRAIEFLIGGKDKESWICQKNSHQEVSVEIELTGELLMEIISHDPLTKYKNYVIDNNYLILRRDSRETEWFDSRGKSKKNTIKNISLFNPNTKTYENPSGIDTTISALLDVQYVYSDLENSEYQDFSKTKIVGKLISEITRDFQEKESWKSLEQAHQKAFGEEGLASELYEVQCKIENILKDQYGETKVEFDFGLPTLDTFYKNGTIYLEDNGIRTAVGEKGTGMQRALALSLIQVYANINREKLDNVKPFFFMLDEPETFLHPLAQNRFLNSLQQLSEKSQVFITTHSPYLLKQYNRSKHTIKLFTRENNRINILRDLDLGLFDGKPTWGEVNFLAFGITTVEFHIELFSNIHKLLQKIFLDNSITEIKTVFFRFGINLDEKDTNFKSITAMDKWLSIQNDVPIKESRHDFKSNNKNDFTLCVYIRNTLDHPEDRNTDNITDIDFKNSIDYMINLYKKLLNVQKTLSKI